MKTIVLSCCLAFCSVSASAVEWLITPDEVLSMRGEQGFYEPPFLRYRAVAPGIEIIKPEITGVAKLRSPLQISVGFKPLADAPMDLGSFKVLYGALRLDITGRLSKYLNLTPTGFTLENAQIPAGKHRLLVQIQDAKQRLAESDLRFEIE